jgi:hypothetical protein
MSGRLVTLTQHRQATGGVSRGILSFYSGGVRRRDTAHSESHYGRGTNLIKRGTRQLE